MSKKEIEMRKLIRDELKVIKQEKDEKFKMTFIDGVAWMVTFFVAYIIIGWIIEGLSRVGY